MRVKGEDEGEGEGEGESEGAGEGRSKTSASFGMVLKGAMSTPTAFILGKNVNEMSIQCETTTI